MLKFTMKVAAVSQNILILLSKQHFSLLSAYQRVTSLERRVSKYSLVVTRVQRLITQHLTFSLCIPVGALIYRINASFGSKLLMIPAKNLPHLSDWWRKAQRRRDLPDLLSLIFPIKGKAQHGSHCSSLGSATNGSRSWVFHEGKQALFDVLSKQTCWGLLAAFT